MLVGNPIGYRLRRNRLVVDTFSAHKRVNRRVGKARAQLMNQRCSKERVTDACESDYQQFHSDELPKSRVMGTAKGCNLPQSPSPVKIRVRPVASREKDAEGLH